MNRIIKLFKRQYLKYTAILLSAIMLFVSPAYVTAQKETNRIRSGGKLKPLQAIIDIRHYTLSLDIDIANESISGYTEIDLVLLQPTDTILLDLTHFYTIKKITVNKTQHKFNHQANLVYIVNAAGFKSGRQKNMTLI